MPNTDLLTMPSSEIVMLIAGKFATSMTGKAAQNISQERTMLVQTEIVSRRENDLPNPSKKTRVRATVVPEFCDAVYWYKLAAKRLLSFNRPGWSIQCTPEQMILWLERLDFTEKQYQKYTNTSLREFIELNPTWPLRAFVGLMLEMTQEAAAVLSDGDDA